MGIYLLGVLVVLFGDFPIKNGDFPLNMVIFPWKTMENSGTSPCLKTPNEQRMPRGIRAAQLHRRLRGEGILENAREELGDLKK